MAQVALVAPPPPGLQEATKNSTLAWQHDLESLFHHAKDRFPDVVWELVGSEEDPNQVSEEVWGHKAIVYARAPPSFQNRYFSFRANGAPSPAPQESALSLGLESSLNLLARTPSPTRPASPSATLGPPTLLRLTTSINPSLFSDELEYLYTGKGFGEAFEFLFDSSDSRDRTPGDDGDPESMRIDKLRKDLVFMWRSRLYSDVRIALTGNFGGSHESTTAIFSSHRFILVSRSPYFHTALISWPVNKNVSNGNEPPTLTLPSPPFTPASLHFTLGFIYTGTLIFSHRSYDLSTAFAILKAALYLSLTTLHDEVQARVVQEMLHGLFHAFIPFAEYERLTGGKWGTGGCRCRQCARRAPRVLEFSLEDDVKNLNLERGARRALVGLFGEGWCTQEFAALPLKLRESVVRGLGKRTTVPNVFPLLFAAEHALGKLATVIEPWGDVVREMIVQARKPIEEMMCKESDACFETEDWMEIMESSGIRFEDGERVEWAMAAVLRGVKEPFAPSLYQTLVSSILLRPHPTDTNAPFLPVTSHVHVQVEQARMELLKWISKRWLAIRQERGFDPLEGWALKEISDHIEVPIDDLLSPPSYYSPKGSKRNTNILLRPISNHPHTSKVDAESDVASSMRVSVLSRSLPVRQGTSTHASTSTSVRDQHLSPSNHSVRSDARSTHTLSSMASTSTISAARHAHAGNNNNNNSNGNDAEMSPAKRIAKEVRAGRMKDHRPDSKLTPSSPRTGRASSRTPSPPVQPSIVEPDLEEEDEGQQDEDEENREMDEEEEDGEDGDGDGRQPSELGEGEGEAGDEGVDGSAVQDDVDDTQSLISTSDVPSVYHTPGPVIQKTLITRASLASVTSRTSSTRTGTGTGLRTGASAGASTQDKNITKPRSLAPSIKSQTPPAGRKMVLSTATTSSSIRTSQYSSAISGSSRPSSRGSTYSTTPRAGRLATGTTTKVKGMPSPNSRPVSRVSTRSISGGSANRPTSTASTATATTDTNSTSTYRTAPAGGTLTTPLAQRQRRTSATSTTSVRTAGGRSAAGSPVRERTRRISGASVSSVASNASSMRSTAGARTRTTPVKRPGAGVNVQDPTKLSPVVVTTRAGKALAQATGTIQASGSGGSVKSSVSSTSLTTTKKSPTTTTTTARGRTLSTKKSVESMKKPMEGAKVPEAVVPPLPISPPPPSFSVPPELPNKDVDVDVDVEKEKENVDLPPVLPLPLPTPPQEQEPTPAPAPDHATDVTMSSTSSDEFSPANTTSTMTIRQKVYYSDNEHKKTSSSASSSSVATLRRKGSSDTIKTVKSSGLSVTSDGSANSKMGSRPSSHPQQQSQSQVQPSQPQPTSKVQQQQQQHQNVASSPPLPPLPLLTSPVMTKKSPLTKQPSSIDFLLASDVPTGSTLEIGIPCIIASKRKRFKAYARYIGEVVGETGPWVGVEVPMPIGGDSDGERADDRQWNDGSWGGIRYFEIGGVMGGGSEWDYGGGEDRAARRRRIDAGSVGGAVWGIGRDKGVLKREGDQLSISSDRMKRMRSVSPAVSDMSGTESRGLFVRPQQVLYVVDAVGADL